MASSNSWSRNGFVRKSTAPDFIAHTHWNVAMTGDKDNGNPGASIGQFALKILTANSGKSDVKNQATWRVWPLAVQEVLRRPEALGTQANRLEHALDGSAHQVVVIDDKHRGGGCRCHSRLRCRKYNSAGVRAFAHIDNISD